MWLTRATALPSRGDGDAQHGEQLLGLLRGEHRRRLVEDDDVGIAAQALDDLDPLAQPGGEVADEGVGIEAEPVALADLADEVAGRAAVEPAALAEGDVLPHAELVDEAEVLVDHADAERRRPSAGRRSRCAPAVDLRSCRCRASTSPMRIRISVDLPAPFSPRMPWTSPRWRSRSMPSQATMSP